LSTSNHIVYNPLWRSKSLFNINQCFDNICIQLFSVLFKIFRIDITNSKMIGLNDFIPQFRFFINSRLNSLFLEIQFIKLSRLSLDSLFYYFSLILSLLSFILLILSFYLLFFIFLILPFNVSFRRTSTH